MTVKSPGKDVCAKIKVLYNDVLTEFTEQLMYTIRIRFHTCEIAIDWPIRKW